MIRPELLWFAATMLVYLLFSKILQKIKQPLFKTLMNPLLWSIILLMIILKATNTDFKTYYSGGQFVDIWLVPATIALAIKLYKNYPILKANFKKIILTLMVGILIHTVSMLILFVLFKVSYPLAASLFPKTVTTALAVEMTASLEGVQALTIIFVIITGVFGNIIGPFIFKVLGIKNPVAQGAALGISSHAVGTSKAIEMGEIQGVVSSVTMILIGIVMIVSVPVAKGLLQWVIL